MTGGSLGQRTSSYGSLHQQLPNSVALPSPTNPITRKPSKMLLSGAREKERFLHRICKFASRRRVGMLLVLIVSVVVFMSVLSSVTKDEARPESPDVHDTSDILLQNNISNDSISLTYPESSFTNGEKDTKRDNSSSLTTVVPISGENKVKSPPPAVLDAPPSGHPCEKFALPPPPADKKRTGPRPCPVCYLPVEQARDRMPLLPSLSPMLRNLTYVYEENSIKTEPFGGSNFGGYPSLKQRSDSFEIKESMSVHCGFVKGRKPGRETGFDIDDADLLEMEQCSGIVVASAIFGNYDLMQQPKNISEAAKTNICFYMFVDKETEEFMRNSSVINDQKKVGIWGIIVANNLPYTDARRNGKTYFLLGHQNIIPHLVQKIVRTFNFSELSFQNEVPKLLLHRIFPNARFSIWIDGKLELIVDPYQILERFLWRKNASFAISRHYRRFDVFEEAEANKAAGKYDNASIDYQVEFYKNEGLTPYSVAKLPITSDVPEGCVIIREHIPITNLFTCLWFNEVDRFTSRDQISFSTVRDKILSKVDWSMNMFLDCERRNFVVQAYHRDLLEHMSPPLHIIAHPPPLPPAPLLTYEPPPRPSPEIITEMIAKRTPPRRHGRDRRLGPRHHHPKTAASIKDDNSV